VSTEDPRKAVLGRIEALNSAFPEYRKIESTIKSLKAEIATENLKMAALGPSLQAAEFYRLVEAYLTAW
jgi:hypothetical protein